jgi:predicted Zn-dependent protease
MNLKNVNRKLTGRLIVIMLLLLLGFTVISSCNKNIYKGKTTGQKSQTVDSIAYDYVFIEAVKQKLLGNMGDAIKLFEKCIEADPQNDAAYFQVAQVLMGAGDTKNGKKYGLKAYELKPGNFWYSMMLAGTYYSEKNLDSAAIFYEKATKDMPDKIDLQLNLGNLYAENKRYDKSLQIFESLDNKYGVNDASTVSTVKVLMAQKKYYEAEEKIKLLINDNPEELLYKGLLAEIYAGNNQKEKAMALYNELMKKNPEDGNIQLSLADFLMKNSEFDDIMVLLNKIILNENIDREQKISLFQQLIDNKNFIEKKGNELQLNSMILEAVYKDDIVVLMIRPQIMEARKLLVDAGRRLEEIIVANPDNYMVWERLLFIYLENKDYKNLEEKGELCSTKFNRSFVAKILYANAAMENKHYEIALEELRKASILAGSEKEMILQVLSMRADVYYRMKDYDNAFKTFNEALKNNNNDLTVLNNYAYYLAERDTRLKEAEIMAKKVIESEKDNTTYLDTYAWVLYKRGKLNEAEKVMRAIIAKGEKDDAEWYEHLGFIMKKKKNCEEAVKNWEKAMIIDQEKKYLLNEIKTCLGN